MPTNDTHDMRSGSSPPPSSLAMTQMTTTSSKSNDDDGERIPRSLLAYAPTPDLSLFPTLFPAPIAQLITALSTSARLSLRMAAFFIEAILEGSQYSTRMSLGYTRRLLITAISSARRVYLMSNAALDGDLLNLIGGGGGDKFTSTDAFLQVLDKYTNLGIYIIHHTFTMAELFAMSGFFLTANAVQSVHYAAQESVALFDSIFGSNESSRALSSIITLVRKEILEDQRCVGKGKIASLAGLTKAMTAFACLQAATWKRTSARFKMKVLYDSTVLAEQSESFAISANSPPNPTLRILPADSQSPPPQAVAGPGPSTMESRQRHCSRVPSLDEVNGRLQAHVQANASRPTRSRQPSSDSWDMEELDNLIGESGEEVYEGPPDEKAREKHRRRRRESTFEITDELRESTVVTHMFERFHPDGRRFRSTRSRLNLPDVAVVVDDGDRDEPDVYMRSGPTSMESSRRQSYQATASEEDENDWIEVDQILTDGNDGVLIPSAPNGSSVGVTSYRDAIEHPQHNAERIQLVLKTMTNKLLQRKRVVRHLLSDDRSDTSEDTVVPRQSSTERIRGTRTDVRSVDWKPVAKSTDSTPTPGRRRRLLTKATDTPSNGSDSSKSPIKKAVSKAESSLNPFSRSGRGPAFKSGSSSETSTPGSRSPRNFTEDEHSGTREPPSTPAASLILHRPPSSDLAFTTSANPSRPSLATSSRPTHRSRPSLSTVHEAVHTSSSRVQAASSQILSRDETPSNLFPHESLIKNTHRFMRYSSAAYGQNFLRIFGLGSSEFMFPSTGKHHANSWAFAQHTNIPIDCLLLSSFTESSASFVQQEAPPLVHYVAVEHSLKAIVLTCRGTLGLSDVLVDLTCAYESIQVEDGDVDASYYVHAGMWQSARKLTVKQSTVHQTLIDALVDYPTYGLVLTGHSLGGGVAALLSILCSMPAHSFLVENSKRTSPYSHPPMSTPFVTNFASGLPPGRPIHCYAYGPPAVTSPDLSSYTQGLITSVVQDLDLVPTLSLGVMKDFKNIALTLSEEDNMAEEIVGRVVGIYRRKFDFQQKNKDKDKDRNRNEEQEVTDEEMLSDWMVSLIKTMRADMDNEKLLPPGMVYIMEHFDVFVTADPQVSSGGKSEKKVVHKQAHRVILTQCDSVEERFREPIFAKTMLQNHLPSQYERSTQLLYEGLGQGEM